MMKRRTYLIICCLVMAVFVVSIYADSAEKSNISVSSDLKDKAYNLQFEGKFEEALPIINESIQQNPNNYRAWATKASILNNLNRYDEALIALDQAIQLDPNEPILMKMKDGILQKVGGSNQSTNSDADPANDFFNKGNAFIKVHNYKDALNAYNQSIQLNPNDARVWNNKGYILLEMNRTSEAMDAINQSIQLNPQFAYAWNTRGFILEKLGQTKEAIDSFNRTIELVSDNQDPNYRKAKGELARLQKSKV